jgi:hypothetical protein
MLIIQASHVGYDPHTGAFGAYRRLQTEHNKQDKPEGLFLNPELLAAPDSNGQLLPLRSHSTAKTYAVSESLLQHIGIEHWLQNGSRPNGVAQEIRVRMPLRHRK